MNEMISTVNAVSVPQQPPPSKYLWTADGWIRGIRRLAPALSGEQGADFGGELGDVLLRHEQRQEA